MVKDTGTETIRVTKEALETCQEGLSVTLAVLPRNEKMLVGCVADSGLG